ncbi:MAG: PstS family phosphate ABC transporter substrate-binding protein, partial [Cyanobacteriota bacterium]|nr:PstS family phosphate ABC transporter substrate-binding protein [Cyanobacteriota bacterium]
MKTLSKSPSILPLLLSVGAATLAASCAPIESQEPQAITIDGSSTVFPITEAIAQEYKESTEDAVDVTVNFSGTSGGFERFCAGETDISDASRPIKTEEIEACREAGVRYVELPVAFDALTVVVNDKNDWVESLTVEELKKIWEPAAQGRMMRWNQIRPDFPDRPINLFGPGSDSGTFDYFSEAIVGESGSSRTDYVASEDDDILVQGVSQDPNALGYFGFAYYEERQGEMKAVEIDSGKGAVSPTRETVENAKYQPLARPLFIYVNMEKAQQNPALRDFVAFYLEKAPELVES